MENIYTIGCDPEIFFEINGEVISAIGMIGGSKHEPLPIDNIGNMVQEDNIAAEFNIPPCKDKKKFVKNINICLNYLGENAKEFKANLSTKASSFVNKSFLKHPNAKNFGCEPDYNVYSKSINDSPNSKTNLRVCGGHIAVGGYDNSNIENTEKIIKSMDLFLGLESVILDTDVDRRKMYGKAGSFRFKDFGLEYRTLSNFWIMNQSLIEWAFENTIRAIKFSQSDEYNNISDDIWNEIQSTINNCDKNKAVTLIENTIKNKELIK